MASDLPGYYQWMRTTELTSSSWPTIHWTGNDTNHPDYGDPCPAGYRMPEKDEWVTLYGQDPNMVTSLGLSMNGFLYYDTGILNNPAIRGYYWSHTADGTNNAYYLYFYPTGANPASSTVRASGVSVRCIQD